MSFSHFFVDHDIMRLSKKEAEEQKTAGRAELDLEKLKVGQDLSTKR